MTLDELLKLLPSGDPMRRLELFLSLESCLAFAMNAPGKKVLISVNDAPRVAIASRMRGMPLPVLTIRDAIIRLANI